MRYALTAFLILLSLNSRADISKLVDSMPFKLSPLDFKKSENLHLQFSSQAEAFIWYQSIAPIVANTKGQPVAELVPLDDGKYGKWYGEIQDGVDLLWNSFRVLFPIQTQHLKSPPLIIARTGVVNAYVAKDLITGLISHAIVVNTGLLDLPGINTERILAVIGHELAHSVFLHILEEQRPRMERFYLSSRPIRYPFQAKNEPAIAKMVMDWSDHAGYVGDLTDRELFDIPSFGRGDPTYLKILIWLGKNRTECSGLIATMMEWEKLFTIDEFSVAVEFEREKRGLVSENSKKLREGLLACTVGYSTDFVTLLAKIYGVPEDFIRIKLPKSEADLFAQNTNLGESILHAINHHRDQMRRIEREIDLSKVRVYTYEDHADDVSAIVLTHAGINAVEGAEFFGSAISNSQVRARCDQAMANGERMPIGALSDAHRPACYRLDHYRRLASDPSLRKNPAEFAARFLKATWVPMVPYRAE